MEQIKKESAEIMFPAQVKVYEIMLEMLGVIREMAKDWDGKVINQRFVTAFKKKFPIERGHLSIRTDLMHPYFSIYVSEGRCVSLPRGCAYIKDDDLRIYGGDRNYIGEPDRRLNLENLNYALDGDEKYLNDKIQDYKWCLEHYDEIKEEVRQLDKQVKELHDRIPYPLKPETYRIENPFEYFFHK